MNLLDLFVKIGVDDQASGAIGNIASKLGNGLKTAAKIGTAAVSVAATGIAALTTAAVKNYAEYEQLVGGAQLMFGKAYDTVAKNAAEAYSTVQMSQNEYLQQVNGFATGLKTALGGNEQAAAELSHRIIKAEADIIAATGNTAENVQNAFNGIMKSNFAMLDNLQIGITPTKEGFQEVIDKVNEWNKANGRATNYQMGNLADMQSALVDYIEMVGMSGYAQAEASKTIQGSLASMKSAWSNLITGIADDQADFDSLIGNMVDSVGTFAENIIPRIEVTLGGIGQLIEKLAPIIVEQLPPLVDSILPMLISTATGLVNSFTTILPSLVKTIVTALVNNAPLLIKAGVSLINSLLDSIVKNKGVLLDGAIEIINELVNGIGDLLPEIIEAGFEILTSLLNGIGEALPNLISKITDIIIEIALALTSPTSLTFLLEAGLSIIMGLAQGILDSIPALIEALPLIIDNIIRFLISAIPMLLEAAIMLFSALIDAIPSVLDSLLKALPQIITSLIDFVLESIPELLDAAIMLFFAMIDAIPVIIEALTNQLPQILVAILDALVSAYPKLFDAVKKIIIKLFDFIKNVDWLALGKNIILTVWNGLKSMWNNVITWFETAINGIFSGIVGLWNKVAEFAGFKKIGTDGALVDLSFMKADISTEGIDWSGIIKDSGYSNSVTINQNIYSEAKTAADLAEESIFEARRATTMVAWG